MNTDTKYKDSIIASDKRHRNIVESDMSADQQATALNKNVKSEDSSTDIYNKYTSQIDAASGKPTGEVADTQGMTYGSYKNQYVGTEGLTTALDQQDKLDENMRVLKRIRIINGLLRK